MDWSRLNPLTWPSRVKNGIRNDFESLTGSPSADEQRGNLNNQGKLASWFATQAQDKYGSLGDEADRARQMLWDQAQGKNSVTAEQLRQGLQSLYGQQRSMAASASPDDAAMAARTAAMNIARLGMAHSGQAALLRLQEQQQAQRSLQDAILGQRAQDQGVALGSRGNAINAYGGMTPDKSLLEKLTPFINAAASVAGKGAGGAGGAGGSYSDRRLKKDIKDADADARRILAGLKAYSFKYKDEKHGKGEQFGVMAQDLEKAGLGHTVVDKSDGKWVDGGKLATALAALMGSQERRLSKLESADEDEEKPKSKSNRDMMRSLGSKLIERRRVGAR